MINSGYFTQTVNYFIKFLIEVNHSKCFFIIIYYLNRLLFIHYSAIFTKNLYFILYI